MKKIIAICFAAAVAAGAGLSVGCGDETPGGGGGGGLGGGGRTVTITGEMTMLEGVIDNPNQNVPDGEYTLELWTFDDTINKEVKIASTLISADWEFSLELPSTIPAGCMSPYLRSFEPEELAGFNISNRNINAADADMYISRDGERVGMLLLEGGEENYTGEDEYYMRYIEFGSLFLVDSDSDITGEVNYVSEKVALDIHFKKGWNWVVNMSEMTGDNVSQTVTTEIPDLETSFYVQWRG